ncbi:DUF3995 domain-containing protein [Cohnella terricola]|uniref:DUF3995 domain-containing protein n=1 Tax=Cohnella terricola TaxID=1289167 RepID=A0A559J9W7_9BACL|nr:DUF3995 domain-containing protein [Cohnella terricola]TVX96679.1 DUF3995 domain-containing protein [Cohnella terricola]
MDLKANAPGLRMQSQSNRRRSLTWSGYAVFIWSVAYMLPHLYWAMGGKLGLSILKPGISESPQWEMINWVASVFLTAVGLLGITLIYLRKRKLLSWSLLAVLLAGCSVATSHGIYGIGYRILQITGVIGIELESFNAKQHVFVLWDLFIFEPWFLIEGILLGILGWCFMNNPRHRRIWLTLCTIGVLFGLITGLLGVRFA